MMEAGSLPAAHSPPTRARVMLPEPMKAKVCACMGVRILTLFRPRSRAEEGRAYPDVGGAFLDGGFEVAAHAHGQGVETVALGVQLLQKLAQLAKPPALARDIVRLGGHAHQAA